MAENALAIDGITLSFGGRNALSGVPLSNAHLGTGVFSVLLHSPGARLIRRFYEADPLLRRCGGRVRVVGFITQADE